MVDSNVRDLVAFSKMCKLNLNMLNEWRTPILKSFNQFRTRMRPTTVTNEIRYTMNSIYLKDAE